jgi:hypothetical protein
MKVVIKGSLPVYREVLLHLKHPFPPKWLANDIATVFSCMQMFWQAYCMYNVRGFYRCKIMF